MYQRYGQPPYRGEVVPRDLAQQIADERDDALRRLERALQELQALRQRGELRGGAPASAHQALETERRALVSERRSVEAERRALEADRAAPIEDGRLQRLAADLANVRRHQSETIAAGIRSERIRLLSEIVGLRDSLQRALEMSPDPESPWHTGLVATLSQLDQILTREGATLMGAPGEPFDPHIHQAVAGLVRPGIPEGLILELHRPGLVLNDGSLVRPAQVIVSK